MHVHPHKSCAILNSSQRRLRLDEPRPSAAPSPARRRSQEQIEGDEPDVMIGDGRHFVLRMVPDLAFFAGLPARLISARQSATGAEVELPTVISTLGSVVREGCDRPEALAVRTAFAHRTTSRVGARAEFNQLKDYFPAGAWNETLEQTIERAREARVIRAFVES